MPALGTDHRRRRLKRHQVLRMPSASTSGEPLRRMRADNQTVRNVFVIGPDSWRFQMRAITSPRCTRRGSSTTGVHRTLVEADEHSQGDRVGAG